MKLKCIGGPCHDKIISDCSDRLGDHVQVREPRKFDITAPIHLDPYEASKMMTDIIHYYIVDVIKHRDSDGGVTEIKFLRFPDISVARALEIALTK